MGMNEVFAAVVPQAIVQAVPDFTASEWVMVIGAIGLVCTNIITSARQGKKVEHVIAQNEKQSEHLDDVQKDLNGRLTQWRGDLDREREETKKYIATAVAAALAEGKVIGAEEEKIKAGTTADQVVAKVEVAVEKVVEVAKAAAKEKK